MEFRGSKKLQASVNSCQVLNESSVLVIANVNDYGGKGKYDTLLYSKAPNLLSEIIDFVETTEEEGVANLDYFIPRFKQLIKEATEL